MSNEEFDIRTFDGVVSRDGVNYFVDGNMWCAVRDNFTNLQESHAGFGETQEDAKANLEAQEGGQ